MFIPTSAPSSGLPPNSNIILSHIEALPAISSLPNIQPYVPLP